VPAWVGTPNTGKTGHSDPRLCRPFFRKTGRVVPSDPFPPSASVCEAYRELIEQDLARGRNSKAIWQDLVSDHGFAGGDQAVKRFVRKLRGPRLPEAAGIILTPMGEEAQVDYGSGPMVREPQSGKYRRTACRCLRRARCRQPALQ
jgi:transposase